MDANGADTVGDFFSFIAVEAAVDPVSVFFSPEDAVETALEAGDDFESTEDILDDPGCNKDTTSIAGIDTLMGEVTVSSRGIVLDRSWDKSS